MANVSNKCTSNKDCKKNGMIKCDGCQARFCSDHFPVHRRELETQLELLCSERDQFHYEFQHQSNEPIEALARIDRWEQKTFEQVRITANNAREQIRQLSARKRSDDKFEQFSEELRLRKETEDFFENDIERLQQQLQQIKILSNQTANIHISYTDIDWKSVLRINTNDNQRSSNLVFWDTPHLKIKQPVILNKFNENRRSSDELFQDTSFLNKEQQEILNGFCQKVNQKWQLIYRGTRDGFKGNDFLDCCSEQGPTITVILVSEYLFGGYTSVNWKNTRHAIWDNDQSAFLFTLTNPHRIPPTKYPIKSSGPNAIRSSRGTSATFGAYDICIHSDCHLNNKSNTGFPNSYLDTTGKGAITFTGLINFQVSEIEVYKQI